MRTEGKVGVEAALTDLEELSVCNPLYCSVLPEAATFRRYL